MYVQELSISCGGGYDGCGGGSGGGGGLKILSR